MAGRNIGHVEFLVDFDGDHLPRQAREIGRKAGAEMGDGIDKGSENSLSKFGTRLRKEMSEHGRDGGISFSEAFEKSLGKNLDDTVHEVTRVFSRENGFDEFAKSFDSIGDASDDLDRKLTRLHEAGRITDDQFLELIDTQTEFANRTRESAAENERLERVVRNIELDRLAEQMDAVTEKRKADTREIGRQWRENQELERVVNDIRFDKFMQELDLTTKSRERASRSADQAAKFAAKEALSVERATASHVDFNREGTKTERMLERLGRGIQNINVSLPHFGYGVRQAALYTGLFTALAPGIAVLGSVSGSGIVSLATGVGALGIGLAAVIPGFKGMLDDVEKLPPKARGAAKAMQDFAEPLNDMQDLIQERMFDGLGDEIDTLRTRTLPRITAGMGKTASTLNGIFDDLLGRLTSPRGLQRIDKIFDGLQPTLEGLGGAALNLGAGLSTVFEAGLKSGSGFATFLEDATADFNAFLNTKEGRDSLTEWFDNLGRIMPGVGDLIGASGKAISDLVTPEAVSSMEQFLSTMTDAVPKVVGGLGGLIDAVDPLNLVADGVDAIGDWFGRNSPGIERFGKAAGSFVRNVGGQLGNALGMIGDELLDIAPGILDDVGDGLTAVGKAINSPQGKAAVESLGKAFSSAGDAVGDLLTDMADSGAIVEALEGIGKAAEVASKGIELFNDGNKAINGDLGIPGGDEGEKAIQNYLAGGKRAWDQGLSDFFSFDPKKGERLLRAWGDKGGLAAGDGLKEGLDKSKDSVTSKADQIGQEAAKRYGDGVGKGLPSAGEKFDELFGGNPGSEAANTAGENAGISYGDGVGKGLPTAGEKFDELFGGDPGKDAAAAAGENAAISYGSGFDKGLPTAGEKFDQLFGGDAGKDAADGAGQEAGDAYGTGLSLGLPTNTDFDGVFGGDAGKSAASGAGKNAGLSYGTGVGNGLPTAGDKFDQLFGGDAGKTAAGAAGAAAGLSYGTGVGAGLPTAGEKFDQLFGGDAGSSAASGAGSRAGGSYTSGVTLAMLAGGPAINLAGAAAANQAADPFAAVPGRVGGYVAGTPGAVQNAMAQVTGQPGADNTVNPFGAVPGRVGGKISNTPGTVSGVMGQITGTPGANNIVNPFGSVPGSVGGKISGTPGRVSGVMGQITGKPGADNVVRPFGAVPGSVGGKVGGTRGAVSGALAGISDFGAAGRIVSAFEGVPGLVSRALGGLGSIVSRALGAARTAISVGIASLPKTATGGMFDGAQARIIGEAGPEAVVPLNRPLSRVDPAVRDLSAIAQGKAVAGNGGGIRNYIADGAIRLEAPNADSRQVAAATVDRIVAAAI